MSPTLRISSGWIGTARVAGSKASALIASRVVGPLTPMTEKRPAESERATRWPPASVATISAFSIGWRLAWLTILPWMRAWFASSGVSPIGYMRGENGSTSLSLSGASTVTLSKSGREATMVASGLASDSRL